MKYFRKIFILLWITYFLFFSSIFAYEFLGNVQKYQLQESGILLNCEKNYQLQIKFLQNNMFRVMLVRPDFIEPPLDYPLVKKNWKPVPVQFEENDQNLILKTSVLSLLIQKKPCRLKVYNSEGDLINEDDPGMGIGWDGEEVRCWKTIAPDEKFFGLGEKTGNLNKRGREWVLWNSDTPAYSNRTDPLYQSIPFFIGMRNYKAYGIYFNNSYRTVFNFGAGNLRYYSFSADGGLMDYFFIYGPQVNKVVQTFTELTGRTLLPPEWSLGYQQSRYSYYPDTEVLRIARTFREKQIPADVIYLDIHYMDGYRVFTWHPERFPHPAELLKQLAQLGFKPVVIIDPGVKADSTFQVAREGLKNNYFLRYPDGKIYVGEVWPGASYFPDFSHPDVRNWWMGLIGGMARTGVRGIWNDMNEPAVWGKAFPLEVKFYDEGHLSNQKKMHNLYGFLMAQTAYRGMRRALPNERPFVLTRAGFAGEQRFTSVWTGDNMATEAHLRLGIRMMLGLGLSGVPFVGTDVGGFVGTPSPELFARWIQVGVFSPLFRNHTAFGTRDQEPWAFGERIEEISKKFIRLRYQLLPYLYNLFWESSESGVPIIRPLFWSFQTDPRVYDPAFQHQFLVGENLMVAPVTREGERFIKIYFPRGKWLNFFTNDVFEGPSTQILEVGLDEMPIFIREGAIIPLGPPIQYVKRNPEQKLTMLIFPEKKYGNFLFYEDDGESFNYLKGAYRLSEFEFIREKTRIEFSRDLLHDQYPIKNRTLFLKFYGIKTRPRSIIFGKKKLKEAVGNLLSGQYRFLKKDNLLLIAVKDSEQKSLQVKINF